MGAKRADRASAKKFGKIMQRCFSHSYDTTKIYGVFIVPFLTSYSFVDTLSSDTDSVVNQQQTP